MYPLCLRRFVMWHNAMSIEKGTFDLQFIAIFNCTGSLPCIFTYSKGNVHKYFPSCWRIVSSRFAHSKLQLWRLYWYTQLSLGLQVLHKRYLLMLRFPILFVYTKRTFIVFRVQTIHWEQETCFTSSYFSRMSRE